MWVSSDLVGRVKNFRVLDGEWESLSDHRNLIYEIYPHGVRSKQRGNYNKESPRWIIPKFDRNKFKAALDTGIWCAEIPETATVDVRAETLAKLVTDACEVAAPRTKKKNDYYNRYW